MFTEERLFPSFFVTLYFLSSIVLKFSFSAQDYLDPQIQPLFLFILFLHLVTILQQSLSQTFWPRKVVKLVISDLLAKFNDLLSKATLLNLTPHYESPKCVDISLTTLTNIPFLYFLEKRTEESLKLKFAGLSKNP